MKGKNTFRVCALFLLCLLTFANTPYSIFAMPKNTEISLINNEYVNTQENREHENIVDSRSGNTKAIVQITNIDKLASYFPDVNFRQAVFNAVKDGNDGAEGGTVEEALYNFRGEVHWNKLPTSPESEKIKDVTGIQLLRNASLVSLKYNMIRDLTALERTNEAGKTYYGDLLAADSSIDIDAKNVVWDFNGNPIEKIPSEFDGRLKIEQAGSSSYTYPEHLNADLIYTRPTDGSTINGILNIAKTTIWKKGVNQGFVNLDNCTPYYGIPGDTKVGFTVSDLTNTTVKFSGPQVGGTAQLSIGTKTDLNYWTQDEYGNITPGAQSHKYYLSYLFKIYDGIIAESFTNGVAKLTKTDIDTGTPLEDAVYGVYKEDGTLARTVTSDANGEINVKGLWGGKYYFQEITAPDGYWLNTDKIPFEVTGISNTPGTFPKIVIGGGLDQVTTTDGKTVLAPTNSFNEPGKLFAGGKDGDGNLLSDPLTVSTTSLLTPDAVEVTYSKLVVNGEVKTDVTRHFDTMALAEVDINKEKAYDIGSGSTLKHGSNILGPVSVIVFFNDPSQLPIAPMTTTDKAVPRTEISGEKIWSDYNNKYNIRPNEVTIALMRNGIEYKTTTTSEAENWEYSFTNVPKLDMNGNTYTYTVKEKDVPIGYESLVYGTTIKNRLEEDRSNNITLEGSKIWVDDNNSKATRPDSIIVELYRNDIKLKEIAISAKDNWHYQFLDLDAIDDNGDDYLYTIKEGSVPDGYTSSVNGMDITNTLIPSDPQEPPITPPTTPNTYDSTSIGLLGSFVLLSGAVLIVLGIHKDKEHKN